LFAVVEVVVEKCVACVVGGVVAYAEVDYSDQVLVVWPWLAENMYMF
jgi:hypothetical protein